MNLYTWLKQVLILNLTAGQVLILDNASFHKSKESEKLIKAAGCKILFLPPYSPDLNPIEKCWANIKTRVKELFLKTRNFSEDLDAARLSM